MHRLSAVDGLSSLAVDQEGLAVVREADLLPIAERLDGRELPLSLAAPGADQELGRLKRRLSWGWIIGSS
jgi:hypothetical protein